MTTVDKVISYINSMDPIAREGIIMELKNIHAICDLWVNDHEEFHKKYSVQEFYNMGVDFESKLKKLIGLKTVPSWEIIYFNLFNNYP